MFYVRNQNFQTFNTHDLSRNSPQPSNSPPKKKKFDFVCLKKNMCNSLNEIECFLNRFSCASKYFKLYNLLKK